MEDSRQRRIRLLREMRSIREETDSRRLEQEVARSLERIAKEPEDDPEWNMLPGFARARRALRRLLVRQGKLVLLPLIGMRSLRRRTSRLRADLTASVWPSAAQSMTAIEHLLSGSVLGLALLASAGLGSSAGFLAVQSAAVVNLRPVEAVGALRASAHDSNAGAAVAAPFDLHAGAEIPGGHGLPPTEVEADPKIEQRAIRIRHDHRILIGDAEVEGDGGPLLWITCDPNSRVKQALCDAWEQTVPADEADRDGR